MKNDNTGFLAFPAALSHAENKVIYIPFLDGMRAIAVFLVILSHYQYSHVVPGGLGVNVFFVISGFIISRILYIRWFVDFKIIDIFKFYILRFFRLFPALFFYIIIMIFIDFFIEIELQSIQYLGALTYTINYVVHLELTADLPRHLGHLWSLAVEEHFYLFFPLILYFFGFSRAALFIFIIMVILVITWRIILVIFFDSSGMIFLNSAHVYQRSDTRVSSILVGVVISFLTFKSINLLGREILNKAWILLAFSFTLIVLSLETVGVINDFGFGLAIQTVAIGLGIYVVAFSSRTGALRWLLSLPPLVWFGKISYSLYLWHVAVMWRGISLLDIQNDLLRTTLAFVAAVAVATFSYYVIENPIRTWGKNRVQAWGKSTNASGYGIG